jgi:hypothetical protein
MTTPQEQRVAEDMGEPDIAAVLHRAALELRQPEPGPAYGCGEQGCAAPLGKGRVLKVTTDPHEVKAAMAARDDGIYDGFARVYVAPRVAWEGPEKTVYAYVREDITPVVLEDGPARQALTALKVAADFRKIRKFEKALVDVERLVPGVGAFARRLYQKGMMLGDMHSRNLGIRPDPVFGDASGSEADLVLFDARVYARPDEEDNLAWLDRRGNPISAASVDRDTRGRVPRWIDLESAVRYAEQMFDVETEDRVFGCGAMGCALPLVGGKWTLKITADPAERLAAETVHALPRAESVGYARILKPPQQVPDKFGAMGYHWAYVREAVDPLAPWWELPDVGYVGPNKTKRPPPPEYWIVEKMNEAALEGDAEFYEQNLDELGRTFGLRHVAHTLRSALARGIMLGDLGSENMGTTAAGRIVMNDAQAFRVVRRPPRRP